MTQIHWPKIAIRLDGLDGQFIEIFLIDGHYIISHW